MQATHSWTEWHGRWWIQHQRYRLEWGKWESTWAKWRTSAKEAQAEAAEMETNTEASEAHLCLGTDNDDRSPSSDDDMEDLTPLFKRTRLS